ncbi:MAG: helix-turn-helix domain-containing protein [Ectobacillus sp.]
MQLPYIILYGLHKVNGERTSSSIYHLLKGKRSSQTLQDGTMYRLSFLFGIYKKLGRHEYDEQIEGLLNENWIKKVQENTYILTPAGEEEFELYLKRHPFPMHIHGLQYGDAGEAFWRRLSLIVQTISHLQSRTAYLPIQQDQQITAWVKRFFLSVRFSREKLAQKLYEECESVLSLLGQKEVHVFVLRLTGARRVGYTKEQIAQIMKEDSFQIHLRFLNVLHFIVKTAIQCPTDYPLLAQIVSYDDYTVLSLSTQKTYILWKQGKSMEEIAAIRRLKRSTIEDHMVEIAMHEPDFPLESFVPKEYIMKIQRIVERMQTRKLRVLKQYAGEEIGYFEIRLVLAGMGGTHGA